MGGLEKRLDALEGRIGPPPDKDAELRRAVWVDILNELSRLKGARARGVYKGGDPPTPIQPTDPAGEVLGYPYTHGQVVDLAIRRVFERERDEAPEILTREVVEELISSWTQGFKNQLPSGDRWDEVECWGPPEPTPPWYQYPRSQVQDLSE